MTGVAGSRLGETEFDTRLQNWLNRIPNLFSFTTFMYGVAGSRLGETEFETHLKEWFDVLGKDKFVAFVGKK